MEFKKYHFRKYSKNFPFLFRRERNKIKKSLGKNTKIAHIGSTAIPGLGGKGIIDIAIKTPKNKLNQFWDKLEKLGYEPIQEHQPNNKRIFFQKIIKYNGKERRIHVHLTLNKSFWYSFILLRDYLRRNKKKCEEYEKVKKEAVKYSKGVGKKYREYKNKFLEKVIKLALKEFKKS
jgi:GrpB-like predicted nucleotidyltransferase (UPF0157 family)